MGPFSIVCAEYLKEEEEAERDDVLRMEFLLFTR
jgi:hypothetical protein